MRTAIVGKIQSAVWFLKRPKLYPQFFHLLGMRAKALVLGGGREDTRAESVAWCKGRAISCDEAIARVTGAAKDAPVESKYPEIFAAAHAKVAACGFEMGGPGALDLLYWCTARLKAQSVIETGVASGWSSLALLMSLDASEGARLISTDMPYVRAESDDVVGLVVPAHLRKRWKLIRLADRQGLPAAIAELGRIDLCHYDSDKSYSGRMWAYPLLWAALRPGGCFISDDIDDNVGFRDFARQVGVEPLVLRFSEDADTKYIGVLIKG